MLSCTATVGCGVSIGTIRLVATVGLGSLACGAVVAAVCAAITAFAGNACSPGSDRLAADAVCTDFDYCWMTLLSSRIGRTLAGSTGALAAALVAGVLLDWGAVRTVATALGLTAVLGAMLYAFALSKS